MTETHATRSSAGEAKTRLDGLVARYSVLGAERRRKRRRAWLARAVVGSGTVAAAIAVAIADWDLDVLRPGLDELRALRSTLATELEAFHAGRVDLERQRSLLEQQTAELSARLLEFDRRAAALEAESADIRAQTARLEAAIARVDEERRALLAAAQSAPASPREVESIEEKQRGLEQQREQFVAQQSDVSSELDLLSRRRQELEERRIALEAQRRELEELLNDSAGGASRGTPVMASSDREGANAGTVAPSAAEGEKSSSSATPSFADFAIASTISPETLGNMRGGIMLGDGMNVSIGLTRSASINGVEQVTNTFTLDTLNRSLGDIATQGLAPVVIQNGPGNVIDSSFLDGIPGFSGTIVQNTLDDQVIDLSTVFDVSISDVSKAMDGVAAGQALRDSLYFQQ